jgi:SAM-dependent methyltransferase
MAITGGMYKALTRADARRMPFADGSLASVMSLSVLEHIPRTEEAVAETFRILAKDGTFAFTAPTDKLSKMLFFTRAFNRIGLAPLGRAYATLYNKTVSHQSLLSEDEWLRLLERLGFEIERREMIIGRRALKAFDLTLPLAVPAQASRLLFGVRGIKRPDFIVNFWEKRLASFVDEDTDEGSNVFIVARKR